jgi:Na+-transporting NADH:ubiquinone oxidoreductase subunit NqrF
MTDRHHVNEREGRVHQTMFFRDTRWFFENVHHHEVHHESQHTSMHQHRETAFVFHILNDDYFNGDYIPRDNCFRVCSRIYSILFVTFRHNTF